MRLNEEAERYLLSAKGYGSFCPDDYDVKLAEIMGDWRQMDTVDLGIVGVPFDTSVMYRPGCRFGPESIRNSLVFSNIYEPSLDFDLKGLKISDFGNIDVIFTDVLETHKRVEIVITEIIKQGVTPLILGGDHGLTYPHVKSLMNNVNGNVGVIMFDAHLDVRKNHHGMISSGTPFRRLMEEPEKNPLQPKNLVEIGINGWLASRYYGNYCKEQGITVIPAREVHKRGIEDVVEQALEIAGDGTEAIWISVDIDCLDSAYAPGTCAPNTGGLTSYHLLEAIWTIGQHPLCRGMDLLEVSPPWDVQNLTSLTAASLCMQFIGATKKRIYG
ncbi:Ureohydrolase [Moorella glycerini]|uniref:Formimidoylglutamase n=1 Tax=Neomoorella stamsii TaxID=1266720 RepID=A0A9X7J0J4_9FIRM|nr:MULTISPECIES: agmatinase family protein [Moorella]PRR68852.1 Formimidoylglutamase [Moorella stamsii]CEP67473.1 Ureohydrolase [Moorella glycerini]